MGLNFVFFGEFFFLVNFFLVAALARGLGPVVMGVERLGIMKALRWELGVILGVDSKTADYTLRAVLEYEF